MDDGKRKPVSSRVAGQPGERGGQVEMGLEYEAKGCLLTPTLGPVSVPACPLQIEASSGCLPSQIAPYPLGPSFPDVLWPRALLLMGQSQAGGIGRGSRLRRAAVGPTSRVESLGSGAVKTRVQVLAPSPTRFSEPPL